MPNYITYLLWKCNHSFDSETAGLNLCHLNICDKINPICLLTFVQAKLYAQYLAQSNHQIHILNEFIYLIIE